MNGVAAGPRLHWGLELMTNARRTWISAFLLTVVMGCGGGLRLPDVPSSPSRWEALVRQGDLEFRARQYATAAAWFREASRQHPRQPIPKLAFGHALFAMGHFDESSAALREGLVLFPEWPRARIDLRRFFTDQSDFDQRLVDLERFASSRPSEAKARFLLAYVYFFTDRRGRALELFARLASENPEIVAASSFLAETR